MGVANQRSIAWGIAQQLKEHGATVALTYAGDAVEKRITPLAAELNSPISVACDVSDDTSIAQAFATINTALNGIDFVVHAIAFSDKDELKGRYVDTSRGNFRQTMDISVFSFTAVAKAAEPYLNNNAALLTLSYLGAEKFVQNYNVMGVAKAALEASLPYLAQDLGARGIRVNAISAGPIRTLAASAIGGFRQILAYNEAHAPLRRNVDIHEVGKAALWLLSDYASGVTAEVLHVDAGASSVAVALNNAETATGLA